MSTAMVISPRVYITTIIVRWIKQNRAAALWAELPESGKEVLRGLLVGFGTILGLAIALFGLAGTALSRSDPSAELFRLLAEIGVGLLIAYSVAIAGVERQLRHDEEHELWVGFTAGVGCAALVALALSVGLAEYRDAGHSGILDVAGFCWTAVSFGMLGLVIAALPLAAYSWRQAAERSSGGGDG